MTKIAVICYSATGNVHALAEAVAEGAAKAGAQVRVRRVPELAPAEAIDSNPAWRAHVEATADIQLATIDDIGWADALAFGSPTRFGNISAQLKQFLDSTGPLWAAGELADKVATGFTSAGNPHGGNESTLLALYNTLHHWGAIVVAPGYTDQSITRAGGNPYGTAHNSLAGPPGSDVLAAARYQGHRLAAITELIARGAAQHHPAGRRLARPGDPFLRLDEPLHERARLRLTFADALTHGFKGAFVSPRCSAR